MNLSDNAAIPSREEVSEFLRAQRKGNRKKACFPCHQRKVGCDGSRPCRRCVDRDHPNICSYEPTEPSKKKRKATSMEPTTIDLTQEAAIAASISESSTPVSLARSLTGGQTLTPTDQFVGDSSVPGFIMNGLSHVDERELGMSNTELRDLLLPALGLARADCLSSNESNEATSALIRAAKAMPRSPEVIRLFQQYKQVVYPLNPHPLDLMTFEAELVIFLNNIDQVKSGQANGTSLPWAAVVFAILAAGSQFSNLPLNERTSGSKRYVREAFACLHAETGFITASIPTITAILVLVTVLQNDLATEAAWSYLGLASRLAQSLGLHKDSLLDQSSTDSPESFLWKAIVWQDCLLSLCFGRQPCTSSIKKGHFSSGETQKTDLGYRGAMYLLASTSLGFLEEEFASPAQLSSQASRLQHLGDETKPQLKTKDACRSIEDHIEYLAFRLNTSFALATLLRPSLEKDDRWQLFPVEQRDLRKMCVDACVDAVESFVSLHKLSLVAERSWAMLHNGLSCALVLLLVDESRSDEKIKQLQQQLVSIISQSSASSDQGSLLWGPHARVVTAVRLLGSARSARSPVTLPAQDGPRVSLSLQPSNIDRYDTGEIALDRRTDFLNDFLNDINNINTNNNTFDDFSGLDLSQHSLNTLYDSILWGDYQTL